MRKTGVSIVLGLVALLMIALPAAAGRTWCAKDPIVALNGHEVQILVAVPEDMQLAVTGPIDVVVRTPEGVTQELVLTDDGFNGHGETVTFTTRSGPVRPDGSFPTLIRVSVPVDTSLLPADLPVVDGKLPMLVTVISGETTIVREGVTSGMTVNVNVGRS